MKPEIVFFFGGGWHGGSPAQFEDQARHFAKRGMIAIIADYRVKSRQGVQVVECVKDAKAAIAWVRENALRLGIDRFAGVAWGCLKLYYGMSGSFSGFASVIFWNCINGLLAYSVIEKTTRPHHKRKDFRFIGTIPVRYVLHERADSISGLGVTRDITEFGLSLVACTPLSTNEKISLYLHLDQKILPCKASVLFTRRDDHTHGMFIHGIKFEELSRDEMDMINLYCFNKVLPRFRYQFGKKPSVLLRMLYKFYSHERFRKHVRRKIPLPLVVQTSENLSLTFVTNDISTSGLSFMSYRTTGIRSQLAGVRRHARTNPTEARGGRHVARPPRAPGGAGPQRRRREESTSICLG